jgi:2-amino-4-hydroxy-6-hydroxymethyldihydropteridine diphosphokinase
MTKREVFISLGTNLGNRILNLRLAISYIESDLGEVIASSSIYETKPWGKSDQPDFLNQVILIRSNYRPEDCLFRLSTIELKMGRKREEKWGSRIIDLDLLYVDNLVIQTKSLSLPHPGIPQRKFVLVPLVELVPDFIHPRLKKNQRQLLMECTDTLEVQLLKA